MENKYKEIVHKLQYCLDTYILGEVLEHQFKTHIAIFTSEYDCFSEEELENWKKSAEHLISSVRDFSKLETKKYHQDTIYQLNWCLNNIVLSEELRRKITAYIAVLTVDSDAFSPERLDKYCLEAQKLIDSIIGSIEWGKKSRK